ncbi:LURP-one-related/scramblase family protein [Erysipelothrix urinaevulpis]|uniref:LURP-one-related/scramblase family protein n=1 Tax=Erysipelothrix urinaevulpis TaxID=2683717 RepID=UPI00135CB143|nr:LURP-one-related family protein [Erysipelothrix urinaevulpis]
MKLYIKQKVFTYKDKFEVRNEHFDLEYKVAGKLFALSKRFNVEDSKGKRVASIKKKIFTFRPHYKITIGDETYTLKRNITFFKHKYVMSNLNWVTSGDFINRKYSIKDKNTTIMSMQKQWFKWGDSYELSINHQQNALLSLCIAIAIDAELASDKKMVRNNQPKNTAA